MEEQEYLRQGNLLVTSTRIEIAGQTFAVRNIGSVKITKPGTPWIAALICVGSALGWLMNRESAMLLVTAAAAFWVWQQVATRRLVLVSGGGETVALKTTQKTTVEKLHAAITQAISAR
jgi:hypothetical protein